MTETTIAGNGYFEQIRARGKLRSPAHARKWCEAVLKTLALNLDRRTKKELARALPPDLAKSFSRVFWLVHFRDSGLSSQEFLNMVSRRSGNTDARFAIFPTTAVFGALKQLIGPDLSDRVSQALAPEVRQLWQQA
jgi:uncharacterized protein (DUF2267 family)